MGPSDSFGAGVSRGRVAFVSPCDLECLANASEREKDFSQTGQVKGFSPVCRRICEVRENRLWKGTLRRSQPSHRHSWVSFCTLTCSLVVCRTSSETDGKSLPQSCHLQTTMLRPGVPPWTLISTRGLASRKRRRSMKSDVRTIKPCPRYPAVEWQLLIVQVHPDKATAAESEAAQDIISAWEVLRDAQRRAEYDQRLAGTTKLRVLYQHQRIVARADADHTLFCEQVPLGACTLEDDRWTYPCRCGSVYCVTTADAATRPCIVMCTGCSLQICMVD